MNKKLAKYFIEFFLRINDSISKNHLPKKMVFFL